MWSWPEVFIAGQVLWGVLLFVPGAQEHRAVIRAMPYLASGAALAYYFGRPTGPLPASAKWLLACLGLLLLNLLHATTQPVSGPGQILLQITIAAPAFWMARAVRDPSHAATVVTVLFVANVVAASVGILQVYYPDHFLPPEFSVLARTLNPDVVDSLTYVGADGRAIVRPPGLSDVPGGAAIAGMLTTVLGFALSFRERQSPILRALCLASAVLGLTLLFLTQVRALSLLAIVGVACCLGLRFRQGRIAAGLAVAVAAAGLVAGAFVWAVSVGGESVADRFLGLVDTGVLRTFDESRGSFVRYTLTELMFEYPLGAGLGRWGMVQVLFGDSAMWLAPPIHVEVQPTGWLLDGGVPLLVLYSAAIVTALVHGYRLATREVTGAARDVAAALLCAQVAIAGLCLAGAVFNTQVGILFWAIAGILVGAHSNTNDRRTSGGHVTRNA